MFPERPQGTLGRLRASGSIFEVWGASGGPSGVFLKLPGGLWEPLGGLLEARLRDLLEARLRAFRGLVSAFLLLLPLLL